MSSFEDPKRAARDVAESQRFKEAYRDDPSAAYVVQLGDMRGSCAGVAQYNPQKTFTRAEVLAVLKAEHARIGKTNVDWQVSQQNLLTTLVAIFERME